MIIHNEISNSNSLANRRAAYLAGTSRSVRRRRGREAPLPTGMCAGHGAIAEAVKVRRVGRKDNANKAMASPEMVGPEEA